MILDAAETVLGFFDFDRIAYSNFKKEYWEKEMAGVWSISTAVMIIYTFHRNWRGQIHKKIFSRAFEDDYKTKQRSRNECAFNLFQVIFNAKYTKQYQLIYNNS